MKRARITHVLVVLLLATGLAAGVASARATASSSAKRRARPARTNPEDASQRIDVNNISMVVKNTGSFAYDTQNGAAGLEFPKGTGKTAVFAAGLWMGAQVGGKVRVSVAEYSDDYRPGSVIGTGATAVADDPQNADYKVYKLNRVYLNAAGGIDAATRDAALADYNAGAVPHGAPVVNVLGDGTLGIVGDQMLWSVYNDLGPPNNPFVRGTHNGASSLLGLGVEVQQTTFAFSRQGPLGNTVFIRYKITNKGPNTLSNAFVSQWSDPDLGGFTDDFVGCDTTLSVGYVYNATNNDEQYGAQSPSVGYDFLQGPKVVVAPGDTVTLGLASFNKYTNGGGPADSTETYRYMQGFLGDGSQLVNPTTGLPTRFNVSGDPVLNTGWLDNSAGDRRLMLSSGPFTMQPGDEQQVVVGIVVAQGETRLASVALMKCFDAAVQAAYDANFNLASPPNNPVVSITPRDGEVFIRWDSGSENYNQPPFAWQGYNVYQGASIAGPWTRVATYDRVDGVTTVLDVQCDPNSPVPLRTVTAFGTDAGVRYSLELTDDKVRGGPLHTASQYYYTVTSYSVGIGQFQQVLESPFVPYATVPQTPPAGVDLSPAGVGPVTHSLTPTAPPATPLATDVVSVVVKDAATMVAADWKVGFKPDGPGTSWYVTRKTGAVEDTVVNNWTNSTTDENFPVVNGIQIRLLSYPSGTLGNVAYVDTAGFNPAALVGVDRGLTWFDGGGGYAASDLGGTIAAGTPAPNTEIRFTGALVGQKAYRYVRKTPATGTIYEFQDYVDVPFTVFDKDANQQKNAAFLESEATANGQWDPSDAGNGGREVVWVLGSNYSGNTPDPFYQDPLNSDLLGATLDLRYEFFPRRTDPAAVIDAGDKVEFVTSIPAQPTDQYTFSTTAPNTFDANLAKGELSRVRAVPNPYFAHSTFELNRFNRVLKFTHLPARCTIRLFNLAGDQVRVLEKNDATSEATWDLNTDHGLPIGSGIYIFHIDAPGVGTTTGKVAVFMEKERLNNF
jgi:hypothetical protein